MLYSQNVEMLKVTWTDPNSRKSQSLRVAEMALPKGKMSWPCRDDLRRKREKWQLAREMALQGEWRDYGWV